MKTQLTIGMSMTGTKHMTIHVGTTASSQADASTNLGAASAMSNSPMRAYTKPATNVKMNWLSNQVCMLIAARMRSNHCLPGAVTSSRLFQGRPGSNASVVKRRPTKIREHRRRLGYTTLVVSRGWARQTTYGRYDFDPRGLLLESI